MKTLIDYPEPIRQSLLRVYPYRNDMKALLIENGYKVPKYFDQLLVAFNEAFGTTLENENIDTSVLKDLWKMVSAPAKAVSNFLESIGEGVGSLLAGAGNILGGGVLDGNQSAPPVEKETNLTPFIIGGLAIVLLLILKK